MAGHDAIRTRACADSPLDDPASTPEPVERLSRDPSEEVRYRAATDPRLSPMTAALLLDDPHDRVSHAVAVHPRLPTRILKRLLLDADYAETAARNPALPQDVVHRMVDLISVPAAGEALSQRDGIPAA
ncbi:hypothetical protein ACQF36_28860 [Streptomyces sp. Marseille-Q5077]|uniref:hypothetical protein n=1 Tax=Streptomyces sp. Marseille-Q5077 TaxID=3418995 RepID=UPI003D003619